jgi:hypothetical protein
LMFLGYLLLVLHFRSRGGYRAVVLEGASSQAPDSSPATVQSAAPAAAGRVMTEQG